MKVILIEFQRLSVILFCLIIGTYGGFGQKRFIITEDAPRTIEQSYFGSTIPQGGDTIYISSNRTKGIKFRKLFGNELKPIVIINYKGQVNINDPLNWGALTFENCQYIKVTGSGTPSIKYGFKLSANTCGLAFSELSSDCEASFINIDHEGFFGIFAKKDYGGNPPSPAPVFANLSIHDCFIENVTEGMYLGETKSPGMEFRHVRIYNNIVRNTGRESIQIANMVEDVKVFNNTLLNAGLDNELSQNNNLQIGDNTVADIYNNIILDAPSFGIICFGMGNIKFTNNYIGMNKGIFTDSRMFTLIETSLDIIGNYFFNNTSTEIIKNMNEKNHINISGNYWNTDISFYKNSSGNTNNFSLENNQNTAIEMLVFVNPENRDYNLVESTTEPLKRMGAHDVYVYADDDLEINEETYQIALSADMITDEVTDGSYWTAAYLVDEQNCNPLNNLHPVGQSWKPYWNMDKGPYYIYIDLKTIHHISTIALHDMHNTKNMTVSIGEPGNWQPLFSEPCDKYKVWNQHELDISTRFIRFGMEESVFAAVNEIVVYGYNESTSQLKSGSENTDFTSVTWESKIKQPEIMLTQNPVGNFLGINIPEKFCNNFNLEIFDLKGTRKYSQVYSNTMQGQILIDLSELFIQSGMYLIKYTNKEGISKSLKFIKNNF